MIYGIDQITDEKKLDGLLNSIIQGEASNENKAKCLRLAINDGNQTTIHTLLDHGADQYLVFPGERLPVICDTVKNCYDDIECLKLLLEYESQKTDEDLDLKTDEQHDQITDEQNQNQKTDVDSDHNSNHHQHKKKTFDDPSQKTDENQEHETDKYQEQEMPALAADAIGLTTEETSRKSQTEQQDVLNKLLLYASAFVNSKCVAYLLGKGACINYQDNTFEGCTPLIAAVDDESIDKSDELRCLQTVDILLNHGADTQPADFYRRTALHWAAQKNMTSVMNRLLVAGCDVNMQDGEQFTPLIGLVRQYSRKPKVAAIKILLKFGAKTEYANNENNFKSAVFHAVSHKEVELLLQEGADPDFKDTHFIFGIIHHNPYDPFVHICSLTKAIDGNNVTAVKLLIQYNCDVNSNTRHRDNKTVSAFRLAACRESTLVMKMLALAGCDRLEMNKCITDFDPRSLESATAHLWQEVKAMVSSPSMLKQLSRLSIRHLFRHLGCRIRKVSQLPLPRYLQDYLMFKELDYCINV